MKFLDNYNKEEIEQIIKQSTSYKEALTKLGYKTTSGNNVETLKNTLLKYNISTNRFTNQPTQKIKYTEKDVFCKNSTVSQKTLRRWYTKNKYTPYICSICYLKPFWQNKPLTLILDHIDGNCTNNELNNLRWVCPNCNQQLETTGYKKMRTKNLLHKKYYCNKCGKEISKNAKMCKDCYNIEAHKDSQYANSNITREKLKELIRNLPFTQIGAIYKVSDNAIRKWCDKYNLPRKKSEINQYTDEEWEKI